MPFTTPIDLFHRSLKSLPGRFQLCRDTAETLIRMEQQWTRRDRCLGWFRPTAHDRACRLVFLEPPQPAKASAPRSDGPRLHGCHDGGFVCKSNPILLCPVPRAKPRKN